MNSFTTVVILCGGESVRFWPFANKTMMSFLGKPLLLWHYEQLVRIGVRNVVVVANQKNKDELKKVPVPKKLQVTSIVQKGKGQGSAVLASESAIPEGSLCIINGSDIYEDDIFFQIQKERAKYKEAAILTSVKADSYFPGGYLKLKENGDVSEIVEKPKQGSEPSSILRINLDVFPDAKTFLAAVKKTGKDASSGYEKAINHMIKKQGHCRSVTTDMPWLYLKYPWHTLSVMDACLDTIEGRTIASSVKIGKHAIIEGPVVIEDNVRICEGVKIVGPSYIGAGTIVGNNTMIRKSHIGSGVVTGFNTDITRSYIGSNSWFHTNFVGDSVIGENVSLGSGTVLANLRLDESEIFSIVKEERIDTKRNKLGGMIGDNVRIGVNASIMPGIKIGSNAFVGAGVVLGEDLPDGKYCRITPSVAISDNTKKAPKERGAFRKAL